MALRTITTLTDDIDGGDADETVTFAFNGTQYEIDLSKKNVDKMVKALQPYTTAARKSGGPLRHRPHHQPRRRQTPARQDPRMGPRQRPTGLRPRPHQHRRPRGLPRRQLTTAPPEPPTPPGAGRLSRLKQRQPTASHPGAGCTRAEQRDPQ